MASQAAMTVPQRALVWLITGASSGLGLHLARLAAAGGHTVIATSRNPTRDAAAAREIAAAGSGPGSRWLALDVDAADSADVVERLEGEGIHVDVLVNNAGYSIHGPAERFTEEETRAIMDTLFFGPYRLMRAVAPRMRERRSGLVVNISSGAGLEGRPSMGVYAAAKAALDGLSKVFAKEVAEFNVRTLIVQLGGVDTPFGDKARVSTGAAPLPADYVGTMADKVTTMLASGGWVADGDTAKAARAIYDVAVGEGVGTGREAETVLPLGRDLAKRVGEVRAGWDHTMEVFGEVCGNVYVEGR